MGWEQKPVASGAPPSAGPALEPALPREMRFEVELVSNPLPVQELLIGQCWVVDGDTIVIDRVHIRLAGIDAPELDHPFGQQAKWALVKLCKGQTVTAKLKPEMSYDRVVAECFLPDGRDLAAEMVKAGLAIDWPKFSGGKYRQYEQHDARKKLWRAAVRQRGMATLLDDLAPIAPRPLPLPTPVTRSRAPLPQRRWPAERQSTPAYRARRRPRFRIEWLLIPGLLAVMVGCSVIGSIDQPRTSSRAVQQARPQPVQQARPAAAAFVVTAASLNVRARPSGNAPVVSQIEAGTVVVPHAVSGRWHAIWLADGSTGWVYGDYLRRAGG